MDVRFNILDKYITKFIVVESLYSHKGEKKKINFDINLYSKFKDKIEHIIIEKEPDNLFEKDEKNRDNVERSNSIIRIETQRNEALKACQDANEEDYILYSEMEGEVDKTDPWYSTFELLEELKQKVLDEEDMA